MFLMHLNFKENKRGKCYINVGGNYKTLEEAIIYANQIQCLLKAYPVQPLIEIIDVSKVKYDRMIYEKGVRFVVNYNEAIISAPPYKWNNLQIASEESCKKNTKNYL